MTSAEVIVGVALRILTGRLDAELVAAQIPESRFAAAFAEAAANLEWV